MQHKLCTEGWILVDSQLTYTASKKGIHGLIEILRGDDGLRRCCAVEILMRFI